MGWRFGGNGLIGRFFLFLGEKQAWRSNALDARVLGVRMPVAQRVSAFGDQKKAWRIPICRTPNCGSTKALQRPYKRSTNATRF